MLKPEDLQKNAREDRDVGVEQVLEGRRPQQTVDERLKRVERDLDNLYVVVRKLNNHLKAMEDEY